MVNQWGTGIERFTLDSVDTEVLKSAVAWLDAGHKATLATVVKTWGSAPRPVGAMLVIRDDGHVIGGRCRAVASRTI